MKTMVYYAVAAMLYAVVMTLLIRELWDILLHPKQHNEIPGWLRYRHSFWFEHRGMYRRAWSKHYWAGVILGVPFLIGGCFALFVAGTWLQDTLFIPQGAMRLRTDGVLVGLLAGLFWVIVFGGWLTYHSKQPVVIALSQQVYGGSRRNQKLKATVGMLIATGIFIPVMALGVESYAYATTDGFVVNRYFSATETTASYGECTAETTWRFDRGQDECYFYYTVGLPYGTDIDLVQACGENWEKLSVLHERLEAADVTLQRGVIDADSLRVMQSLVTPGELEHIREYFIIE